MVDQQQNIDSLQSSNNRDKIVALFSTIEDTLTSQNILLKDILRINEKSLKVEKESIESENRKQKLQSVEESVISKNKKQSIGGIFGASDELTGGSKTSFLNNLFTSIGPGLTSLLGGAFSGLALSSVGLGGLLLKAIPLAVLAPLVGEFLGDFAKQGLKEILSDDLKESETLSEDKQSFIDSFGKNVRTAGTWGAIGAIFGRKFALIFAGMGLIGGALTPKANELLEKSGFDDDEVISAFGKEFKREEVAKGISTAMAAGFAVALAKPGLWKKIGIPGMVIGATIMFGDKLKKWFEEQGVNEGLSDTIVDTTSFTAIGASLGGMFGPTGLVVGAAVGLAIGLGKSIVTWLRGVKDRADASFRKQIREADEIISRAAEESRDFTPEERSILDHARDEAERRTHLAIPEEKRDEARKQSEEIGAALERDEIKLDRNDVTQKDIDERVDRALDGEFNAARALFNHALDLDKEKNGNDISMEDRRDNILKSLYDFLYDNFEGRPPQKVIDKWDNIVLKLLENNNFKTGTKGFQDFGEESLAKLHGIEAVVPRNTPAGVFLDRNFDEEFRPKLEKSFNMDPTLEKITSNAQTINSNVIYAPTSVSPVTSITQGGSSVSSVTSNSMVSTGGSESGSGLGRFAN